MTSSLDQAARRNVLVLAAGMAALYGMVELVFGVAGTTFEEVGGSEALEGLAPGIFLACSALAALPAGRAMDRRGRRPVLAAGFAIGTAGCALAALGVAVDALPAVRLGFALTGVATGMVLLSRAAAADMFAPAERPRAIGHVLFGAVFGALLGPLVFGPLLSGDDGASALDIAWLAAAGFMAAGLLVVWRLRPDPRDIARALGGGAAALGPAGRGRPLREMVLAPGVPAVLLAVLASWAGMLAAMGLVGSALIDHGHEHSAVFPVLAAHFTGMFAFFAVVGWVIQHVGRTRAIAGGLLVLGASSVAVAGAVEQVHLAALALFGVGLGWSLSFVAATAELSERVHGSERATVIGFADLLGGLSGAALVVAGGVALDSVGVVAVAVGGAIIPVAAAVWTLRLSPRPAPAAG